MKHLYYYWRLFLLERLYRKKLKEIELNRFKFCRYGLIAEQRSVVHEWYAEQQQLIYNETYGGKE